MCIIEWCSWWVEAKIISNEVKRNVRRYTNVGNLKTIYSLKSIFWKQNNISNNKTLEFVSSTSCLYDFAISGMYLDINPKAMVYQVSLLICAHVLYVIVSIQLYDVNRKYKQLCERIARENDFLKFSWQSVKALLNFTHKLRLYRFQLT